LEPDASRSLAGVLAAMARDALLDHLQRGEPHRALRLIVAAASGALGRSICLQAVDAQGQAWHEGPPQTAPFTSLPLTRLGRPLGHLHLQGHSSSQALEAELQPLLATLTELLFQANRAQPMPGSGAPQGDLIRAALAGADTFVWEWTLDNDWLTDIDQGLLLLGWTVDQVGHTQEDWNRLMHPDDRAANHEAYLRHERGEVFVYEHSYRIQAVGGEWRWMQERGRIIERHADGRPSRMVGTQTDITQRRALEAAALQTAQAQAASAAKTQFLARMSHELRTPLNAVLGFAQLMEMDHEEPPAPGQLRRLKLVREAGEHLLHMINDMLDLTRIESGGMLLTLESVPLRALVVQALDMVRGAAEVAQVQLDLAPGEEVSAQADRTRTRQVLLNLLTNAIKYNRAGGRVTVVVGRAADGQAQVEVRDTGVGIAESALPHIFEPFHRGDQQRGAVDGAGIGLSVTQALAELMDGRVRASSTLGVGSVFTLQLPDHLPPSPEAQRDTQFKA
jgi:PAS domain S-box-containing protein